MRKLTQSAAQYFVLAVLVVPLVSGCAHTVQSVASTAGAAAGRAAAPALVDRLDQLSRPENQNKILAFARSPAVQTSAHDVGNGVGQGITDEFVAIASGSAATQPASRPTSADEVRAALQRRMEAVVDEAVRSAVARAMQELASREGQATVATLSETAADAAVRGGTQAFARDGAPLLAQAIRQQIAPAIGDAVRQQLAQSLDAQSRVALTQSFQRLMHQEIMPDIRELWDQGAHDTLLLPTQPNLAPAMRKNADNLAYGTATGTHQALIEMHLLSPTGGLTGIASTFVWGVTAVLVLVGLASAAVFVAATMYAISLWRRQPGK